MEEDDYKEQLVYFVNFVLRRMDINTTYNTIITDHIRTYLFHWSQTATLSLIAYTVYNYIHILVNNYELSDWEEYYLRLWSTDTSKDYIHSGVLLTSLSVSEFPVFRSYFRPFSNKVSMTLFIEFICIFGFFTNEQLIPLIFTLNNIQSNKVATEQQVMMLFKSLLVESIDGNDIRKDVLEIPRDPNGFLPLSEISNILRLSPSFLLGINKLRREIIQKVIKDEYYLAIQKRILYYNNYPPDEGYNKPKESCIAYIARKLFSYRPPSFYFDHKPLSKFIQLDETLFVIRKRYGYSSRPDRYSSVSLSNCLNHSRHNSAANSSHNTLRSRASTSILNNYSLNPNNNNNNKTPIKSKSILNDSVMFTDSNSNINNNNHRDINTNNNSNNNSNSNSNNINHQSYYHHCGSSNCMRAGKYNHLSVKIVPIDGGNEE